MSVPGRPVAEPWAPLRRRHLDADPAMQLQRWLDATTSRPGPRSMALCTVDADRRPSVRTVPLRHLDEHGLVFFTSLRSAKGLDLRARPDATAALFTWSGPDRQVRVDGRAEVVEAAESDRWFAAHPTAGQAGAWVTRQPAVLADRAELQARVAAANERFPSGHPIPRPDDWVAVRLRPRAWEFWQAAPDRCHDRFRYRPTADGWAIDRLAP